MLIALLGGAAGAAASGINGISVYGVITPTLPVDKRRRWALLPCYIGGATKVQSQNCFCYLFLVHSLGASKEKVAIWFY